MQFIATVCGTINSGKCLIARIREFAKLHNAYENSFLVFQCINSVRLNMLLEDRYYLQEFYSYSTTMTNELKEWSLLRTKLLFLIIPKLVVLVVSYFTQILISSPKRCPLEGLAPTRVKLDIPKANRY